MSAPDTRGGVFLCPITISAAAAFVKVHHRHHRAPRGGLFAVAASNEMQVVGVAIVGRPVSRMLADGWTAEVTRLATDGTPNCCSMLYAAAWRACRALGYRKLITYILVSETGTSLRAAGWNFIGRTRGGSWDRGNRPRIDRHPTEPKLRWEKAL